MTQTTRIQPTETLAGPAATEQMVIRQRPLALVLGGTGKVGRRVAARLTARGVPVRIGARFTTITADEFTAGLASAGLHRDEVSLVSYLFSTVLDGRNSSLSNGVERALRDFADYARETAKTGIWNSND